MKMNDLDERSQSWTDWVKSLDRNSRLQLMASLKPRLTKYIPHNPSPKQSVFLNLTEREAFYGGAASGGKSDAILMGALQWVDIPGYSAIIFRKTLRDHQL